MKNFVKENFIVSIVGIPATIIATILAAIFLGDTNFGNNFALFSTPTVEDVEGNATRSAIGLVQTREAIEAQFTSDAMLQDATRNANATMASIRSTEEIIKATEVVQQATSDQVRQRATETRLAQEVTATQAAKEREKATQQAEPTLTKTPIKSPAIVADEIINIAGVWRGTMNQALPNGQVASYVYVIEITQIGNSITGFARSDAINGAGQLNGYYAILNLEGQLRDNILIYSSYQIQESYPLNNAWGYWVVDIHGNPVYGPWVWCWIQGELTYNVIFGQESLHGRWVNTAGCGNGEISLIRQ